MQKENFIIHVAVNLGGGLWSVMKNLIEYQLESGYKVGLVYPVYSSTSKNEILGELDSKVILFPVQTTYIKGFTQLVGMPIKKIFKSLRKKNKSEKIIFHAHSTAAVGLLRNIKGVPLICTIHAINTSNSIVSNKITSLILKKIISYKYPVTGVSDFVSTYYNDILATDKIVTVLNGSTIKSKNVLQKQKKFTIGFVGAIIDLKGWRYIIDAYSRLEEQYRNDINLILAGPGPEKNIVELNELIEPFKANNNIKYLGQVEEAGNYLIPYLDLIILPSESEGLPMTLIEALGHSVPILATEVGGIPEILIDGYNGFFIKRNPIDIADKIKYIYDNETIYKNLCRNSNVSYNNNFTSEKMNEKYLLIYSRGF